MSEARNGKIASLPARIRAEVNQRLHDGQQGPQILPWLNELPEVLKILDEKWGEEPVSANNLSEWRRGGYQEYLDQNEKIERTRQLADYCRRMGEASGGSAIGLPAAVAGGQLMEVLEDFDPSAIKALLSEDPESYIALLGAIAKLQKSSAEEKVVPQNDRRLAQMDRKLEQTERQLKLAEEKHRLATAEAFLQWREDERAREIADSAAPQAVKMEQLVQLMFGERPANLDPIP